MSGVLESAAGWSDALLPALWRASWQGAIAIAAVWLVTRVFTLSPRVICWAWRLVCLKMLIALVWMQPIELAVLPRATIVARSPAAVSVPPPRAAAPIEPEATRPLLASPAKVDPPQAIGQSIGWRTWLAALWCGGLAVCVAFTIRQWLHVRRLRAACSAPLSNDLAMWTAEEAARLRIRRRPRVLVAQTEGPLLIGILRPAIVLPARAEELFSEAELRLMLRHELAHLKRRDLLWNWLPTVVDWLFFFHPLLWLLKRGWFESQEAACDELLIQNQAARPAEYGRLLVKLATLWPSGLPTSVAAAGVLGVYQNLERRIFAMSRVKVFSRSRLLACLVALVVVGAIGIAPWRLVAKDPDQNEKPANSVAAGNDLSRVVKFELGRTDLREGDKITIDEVIGTASTMTPGNVYQVKGSYKLATADKATIAAYTTVDGNDPESARFANVPIQKTQTAEVKKGEGRFTLVFYMWQRGWPHVSFYSAKDGNGIGGVYFGTGDSVYKPTPKPVASDREEDSQSPRELSHVVKFEIGQNDLPAGDKITIDEVVGTSDEIVRENLYQVKGTYKLASADQATIAAYTTVNANDPENPKFANVPELKTQSIVVKKGEGHFTLTFYMWQRGCPHVSFYSKTASLGGVYFGTGESVYKPAKAESKKAGEKGALADKEVKEYAITVAGKASDAEGNPISNAQIYLVSTNISPKRVLGQTTTAANGRYEFRDAQLPVVFEPNDKRYPPQGCFQVFGQATNHAFAWQGMKSVLLSGTAREHTYILGDLIELDLKFVAPESISGQFFDENEQPISGLKLQLWNCNFVKGDSEDQKQDNYHEFWAIGQAASVMPELLKTTTDPDGRFAFSEVPPGTVCWVHAEHPDFGSMALYATTAKPAPARFNGQTIERQPIKVILHRTKEVPLHFEFVDTGKPAPHVHVSAYKQQSSGSSAGGETDADGNLTLKLPPGEYKTCCDPKGTDYVRTYGKIYVKKDEALELTRLPVEQGCIVTFKAIDAVTGNGIPDVTFWYEKPEQPGSRWGVQSNTSMIDNPRTDSKGELRAVVFPSTHVFGVGFEVLPNDYRPVETLDQARGRHLELLAGESMTVEFKLQRPAANQ